MQDLVIVSSTSAHTPSQFATVIDSYCKVYWTENPDLAAQLAWDLWDSGRLIQPRTMGFTFPTFHGPQIWPSLESYKLDLAANWEDSMNMIWALALVSAPKKEDVLREDNPLDMISHFHQRTDPSKKEICFKGF